MKDNKGITIVALVVQIIVMIIIAGVVISGAIGKNGIITMALRAVGIYLYEQSEEQYAGTNPSKEDNPDRFTIEDLIEHFEIPVDQTRTDVIGISEKKTPVNMDYWEITEVSEGFTARYIGPIQNNTYIEPKPTYIKKTNSDGTVKKGHIVNCIIETE